MLTTRRIHLSISRTNYMLTNQEAKIYLAEQLPEKITLTHTMLWCKDIPENPYPTCRPVLETEWQQIALWVEEKMTDEQSDKYRPKLFDLTLSNKYPYGWARGYLSASYATRATAMKESGL